MVCTARFDSVLELIIRSHAVRFARTPFASTTDGRCVVNSEITITNDSGELLDQDINLVADLAFSEDNALRSLRCSLRWHACTISIPLQLPAPELASERTARLWIGHEGSNIVCDSFEDIGRERQNFCVASIWCDVIGAAEQYAESSKLAQRRFSPRSSRALQVFEDSATLEDTYRFVQLAMSGVDVCSPDLE